MIKNTFSIRFHFSTYKIQKFYFWWDSLPHIAFRQTLHSFFDQMKNEDDTWTSMFERYNLEMVNPDLICNVHSKRR